ncbi:MAG: hypothetical protein QOE77_1935 [Blastocatellia bacterium]|nr:hypothetical protein [Blastocatellia bacterium]
MMTYKNWGANTIFLIMFLITIAIPPRVGTAAAQVSEASEPRTVADFLLLVPERYIGYDLRFREEMLRGEHRGVVVDIRNGYISYDASDNPSGFEFAIFRKSNGGYIVAYNDTGDDFDREPKVPTLRLLSYEGRRWRDVTKVLLPVALDGKLGYTLPRTGRNISVTGKGGRELYTLIWAKDRFRIKRPARS